MAYSNFSLRKVKEQFDLKIVENEPFLADIVPVAPSDYLTETLTRNVPLAIAVLSVVVSTSDDDNCRICYRVNQTMLLINASRPVAS